MIVVPGNVVSITANTIRAACSASVCSDFSSSTPTVPISVPMSATAPLVKLSSSPTVYKSDGIYLNPTATIGSAGRSWQSVSWAVSVATVSSSQIIAPQQLTKAATLSDLLNAEYATTTAIVPVLSSYLASDLLYTFTLTVTNFLSQSAASSVSVFVHDDALRPSVSILGSSVVFMYSNQTLSVIANGSTCQNAGQDHVLAYSWAIEQNDDDSALPMTSESSDPKIFKLSAYTLTPGKTYKVSITVTDMATQLSASDSKLVQVAASSGITAAIAGGSFRSVSVKSKYATIDASSSIYNDYPSSFGLVSFSWSCEDMSLANYGQTCVFDDIISAADTSLLTIPIENITIGSLGYNQYQISVTVKYVDDSTVSGTDSMILRVTKNALPTITFGSMETKYNTNSKIVLTGIIAANSSLTVQDETAVRAIWSSPTLAAVSYKPSLSSISLSPTNYSRISLSNTSNSVYLQLVIAPNTLTAGATYQIRLSAGYVLSSDKSILYGMAETSITINEPPSGGEFSVSPSQGQAISTPFLWLATSWSDDATDYPLSFVFYYKVEGRNSIVVLKSKSQQGYAMKSLAQGLSTYNYTVACYANISDIFDGTATTNQAVTVSPSDFTISSELQTVLDDKISIALAVNDAEGVMATISSVLGVSNTKNCSYFTANYCSALNRTACSDVVNSCGRCLAGFISNEDYSQAPCVPQTSTSILRINEKCSSSSQCLSNYCDKGLCTYPSKKCPNNCSGLGSCVFRSKDNASSVLSSCSVDDFQCQAKCICKDGYYGDDCGMNSTASSLTISYKSTMCRYLNASSFLQDHSHDSFISIASIISDIFADTSSGSISGTGFTTCLRTLVRLIGLFPELAGADDVQPFVSMSLSNALSNVELVTETLRNEIMDAINYWNEGIQANMAIGETGKSIVRGNIRQLVAVVNPLGPSGEIALPQTDSEKFDKSNQSVITIGAKTQFDAVGVTLSLSSPALSQSSSLGLISPSIAVQIIPYTVSSDSAATNRRKLLTKVARSPSIERSMALTASLSSDPIECEDDANCFQADFLLYNDREVSYSFEEGQTWRYSCLLTNGSVPYDVQANCSNPTNSSQTYSLHCPGNETRIHTYKCPDAKEVPRILSSLDSVSWSEADCDLSTYSAARSQVSCSVRGNPATAYPSRRLMDVSRDQMDLSTRRSLSASDSTSQSFAVGTKIIASDFVNTWKSAEAINLKSIERNVVIAVVTSILLAVLLGGVVFFIVSDLERVKKHQQAVATAGSAVGAKTRPSSHNGSQKVAKPKLSMLLDAILPLEFSAKSWHTRFMARLGSEHDWFGLILKYDKAKESRGIKWIKVTILMKYRCE